MGKPLRAVLAWRARHRVPVPWRRWPRGLAVSVCLVVIGGAGAVVGGWLVGRWCMGLVVIAESAGLVWVGLGRDDGQARPVAGSRTVRQVLADERDRMVAAEEAEEAERQLAAPHGL